MCNVVVQVYSFAQVLLELAVGDAKHIKNNTYGRSKEGLKWRPPIPDALREERSKLIELIERCWDHDFRNRPDSLEIDAKLTALSQA